MAQLHKPHIHNQRVPRGAIIGAGALMLATIGLAAWGRSAQTQGPVVSSDAPAVMLHFADREDGAVVVSEAESHREVAVLAPGSNGFVRGVLRSLTRTRRMESIGRDTPFRLSREADGRLLLSDPESGRAIELRSFGRTNYEAFARLYVQGRAG